MALERTTPGAAPGDADQADPVAGRHAARPDRGPPDLPAHGSAGRSSPSFGYQRFTNRELSRLDFLARLLDLTEDAAVPCSSG